MKSKPTLTPEQIREHARVEDAKLSKEFQKTMLRLTKRLTSLSVDDILSKLEVRSSQTGAVIGHNAGFLKDLATTVERLQRIRLLALQDTPAERAHREPVTSTSTYDQHKLAIDAEVQLLLDQHAQDVQVIETTVDVTPVEDLVTPVPSKPLKLKYNPDTI